MVAQALDEVVINGPDPGGLDLGLGLDRDDLDHLEGLDLDLGLDQDHQGGLDLGLGLDRDDLDHLDLYDL
jgi:hypothetical protein